MTKLREAHYEQVPAVRVDLHGVYPHSSSECESMPGNRKLLSKILEVNVAVCSLATVS